MWYLSDTCLSLGSVVNTLMSLCVAQTSMFTIATAFGIPPTLKELLKDSLDCGPG